MRWSQLKKMIEATFADHVKGRVEVFVTRYRHAHDAAGEAWIVIGGKRRLAALDTKKETALARRLHAFRCEVENVVLLD